MCGNLTSLKETASFEISPQLRYSYMAVNAAAAICDKFANKVNSLNWHGYTAVILGKPLCIAAWKFNYSLKQNFNRN